jgi:hypothetical protein
MGWSKEGDNFQMVGREPQISLILQSLASLWQAPTRNPAPLLLHFYGMRGIGKTRLLETVKTEVQKQPPGPGLLTLFLTTPDENQLAERSEAAHYRALDEIDVFFNDFYKQFRESVQLNRLGWQLEEYERLLSNRSQIRDEEGLWLRAKTLASDLSRLRREAGLRLLILEDSAPTKVFQWLSKFFYKDLLAEGALCVVATGFNAPVVSTLSLVQYFKCQPLLPLQSEEVQQALKYYDFPALLQQQLIELSAGHPSSLARAVTELKPLLEERPDYFEKTGKLNREGLARITNAVADTLLEGVNPTLARCCRLISPLRSFRYDTLAALLPALMPEDPKYGRASVVDYMLLGKELNDQIDFIESDKTYVMHPIARTVLSKALRYSDPKGTRYRQVNLEAINYYTGLMERLEKSEQRYDALLEEIYHRLLLVHLEVETEGRALKPALSEVAQVLDKRLSRIGGLEGNRRLAMMMENDRDFRQLFPAEIDDLVQMLYEARVR